MLTSAQIQDNKKRYIELISSIKMEGADIQRFLKWLEGSDFFEAPASSKYHCDYKGGLCEHSLHVYDNLVKLAEDYTHKTVFMRNADLTSAGVGNPPAYDADVLKVVALLHDISKTNFYEVYFKNVKDEYGNWTQVANYKVREDNERFIYGSHEQNAEYIASTFFPLGVEERSAILHHHGGMSWDSAKDEIGAVYGRFPLALLLHVADMISTFIDEGTHELSD